MAIEYNNVIRSVNCDQHSILKDIMDMHNGGNPFEADITYSIGAFYGIFKRSMNDGTTQEYEIPRPKFTFDVTPQDDMTQKLDPWGDIPLKDNSIGSMVVDLPFIISPRDSESTKEGCGKEGSNITFKRFSSYYPVAELLGSYSHWIYESFRVLRNDGILVWKCQNTITGGKFLCTEEWSWLCALSAGFEELDRFTLVAKSRLHSGKIKRQQHARNFSSSFWVFKKSHSKQVKYFDFMNNEERVDFSEKLAKNITSQPKAKKCGTTYRG